MAHVKCPVCTGSHELYAIHTITRTVCPHCWFEFSPRHGESWKQCDRNVDPEVVALRAAILQRHGALL